MCSEAPVSAADAALDGYSSALDATQAAGAATLSLLAALLQRDRVAAVWGREPVTPEAVQRLAKLDERLHLAAEQATGAEWPAWRQAANPPARRWWWWLDEAQAKVAEDRDFLWVLAAGVFMTMTLGLGTDISARLWGGGAGALSVVSAAVTLALTGGPLTTQGRQLADWLIGRLRLPPRYRGRTTLAAAVLFFLLAVLLRLVALPAWARVYNNRGVTLLHSGDLTGAGQAFARAVSINPEYAAGYYNLAVAYAEIADYEQSASLFRQALAADRAFDLAYSGLGYTLIAQGEADQAIPILYTGLSLAQDDASRVALLTNLGRAWLEAGRPYEAESALAQALTLNPQEAAAHCTLGLVAEELHRPADEIRLHWETCLSYADVTTPRGLELADMARAQLRALEAER